jgi:hypothetical protein
MAASYNIANVTIGLPKTSSNGHKLCSIKDSSTGRGVFIQSPQLTTPWGLDKWNAVSLSLDSWESPDSPSQKLYHKLLELDELVLTTAVDNSFKWFGEHLTRAEIAPKFDPLAQQYNPDFPPTLRVKTDAGTKFFNERRERTPEPTNKGKGKARVVIQPSFVYFKDERFGLSIRAEQFWLTSQVARDGGSGFEEFMFVDDDDSL